MAMAKYENIWNMLKSYNFELDDNIRKNFLCTICKRILKNACNVSCGCRYCSQCLIDYLDGREKPCPGTSKDCYDKMMNIQVGIQVDQAVNFQISKLIVKCPRELCDFRDELRNMETHLQMCDKRLIECPFISIGCRQIVNISEKLITHLSDESLVHSRLVAKCIEKLSNEMMSLKSNCDELKQMNHDLNATIETMVIDNAAKQKWISKLETSGKLKISQILYLKHAIVDLKKENEAANCKIESNQKSKIKPSKNEIKNEKLMILKDQQIQQLNAEIAQLKREKETEKLKLLNLPKLQNDVSKVASGNYSNNHNFYHDYDDYGEHDYDDYGEHDYDDINEHDYDAHDDYSYNDWD